MYFLKKKHYVIAIFLLINLLQVKQGNAQYVPGSPIIQTFPFPDSYQPADTISVFEDPQGYFLLGTKGHLVLFYGNEFVRLPVKGQVHVIANQQSVLYSGYNEMGIIKFYKNSQPQLIPLFNAERTKINFGQIYKVFLQSNNLYFNTDRKLFVVNEDNDIKAIDSSRFFLQLFRVADTLLVFKPEIGFCRIENEKCIPIPIKGFRCNNRLQLVIAYKGGWLVKPVGEDKFIFIKDLLANPITLGFEPTLQKTGINDMLILPDNTFVIATISAGIFFYNPSSRLVRRIGVSDGLLDNTVLSLHTDWGSALWAFHPKGISCIEGQNNISVLGRESGLQGEVMDIKKFGQKLWIATSDGLFVEHSPIRNESSLQLTFKKVKEIIQKCIKLDVSGKHLHVFTPTGIFLFCYDEQPQNFIPAFIRDVAVNTSGNQVFIAGNEGIVIGQFGNNTITFTDTLLRGIPIRQLEWSNQQLWFETTNKQLGKINARRQKIDRSCSPFFIAEPAKENTPLNIIQSSDGLRFCYNTHVYGYDEKKNKLISQPATLPMTLEEVPFVVDLLTDNQRRWYGVAGKIANQKGILVLGNNQTRDGVSSYFFRTGSAFSPLFVDTPYVWIGGKERLFCYKLTSQFTAKRNFVTIIKRMVIGNDSVLRIELEDPEISYRYHNIKFEVASTHFESEPFIRYQYRLMGYQNDWSDWTQQTTFTFRKLPPGPYTFQVRALDLDGTLSESTELNFYVLPPFYRTLPAYILYVLIFLFAVFVFLRYRTWRFLKKKEELDELVQKRTAEILREKEKSEQLIANLLPKSTADELKQTGKASSQKFSMVTVLFSDIQGFTKIAEQMNPEALIDQLDSFFFHFDSVIEKYNIEKIKTIGDAYMCAGGLPNKNITNPVEVVLAALEMVQYMENLKATNSNIWDLRIGIHTGSVIAGVVGHKKLSYDIWGDTVNTASRMESSGEAGKINISGQTYELVKDFFICEYRGKMPVKYKGEIDMYFVKGIHPDLAGDSPYVPNEKFFLKLQLLRLQDVEEHVFGLLRQNLPPNIYFHSAKWQEEIYYLVDLYSRAEELTLEETLLVRTAALLMDVGYIWSYDEHESESIRFARETLPQYRYSDQQIQSIVNLIEATRGMRKPENKMEEILIDAEMSYLGRADFETLNELYFREMYEHQKVNSWDEWAKMQIVILSNHRFYTHVANVLRDVGPEKQIELLLGNIKNSP